MAESSVASSSDRSSLSSSSASDLLDLSCSVSDYAVSYGSPESSSSASAIGGDADLEPYLYEPEAGDSSSVASEDSSAESQSERLLNTDWQVKIIALATLL